MMWYNVSSYIFLIIPSMLPCAVHVCVATSLSEKYNENAGPFMNYMYGVTIWSQQVPNEPFLYY